MYTVSFYKNIEDTISQVTVSIDQYLNSIKKGKYRQAIELLRAAATKKEATAIKKTLPNITASGTFSKRVDACLIKHSGLKQIDFDHDKNPEIDPVKAKEQLSKDRYTFAAFISPTGKGVKLLVLIDPGQDKDVYPHLEAYYKTKYGLELDTSCSNVSRAMFVSFDENLYYNPASETFLVPATGRNTTSQNKPTPITKSKVKEVELLVEKIEAAKIDITGDYKQWLKIGFAIASEFGAQGEDYFHRISKFSSSYSVEDCTKQYKECCKQRKSGVGINSFFLIAKSAGVLLYDSANNSTDAKLATNDRQNKKSVHPNKDNDSSIFYSPIFKTDDEGNSVLKDIKINYVKFVELLYSFGFRRYDIDKDFIYIQLTDKVIKEVTILQIQDYFFAYLESLPDILSNSITKKALKEKLYNNPKNYFCDNRLSLLINKGEIVFNSDSKQHCYIYYRNGYVCCNPDKWELRPYNTLQGYIWKNQIIDREFKYADVTNLPVDSLSVYAQFLYMVCNRDFKRLTSLCSIIGYLLHSYTDVKMKAVILTDSKVSEEANGRTGKTLFGQTLRHIKKLTQVNGKDFDPTNRYKYQEANLDTQIIFLNDVRSNFRFEVLYNDITEGITVEKKNQTPFTLKTKMLITTNKTIAIDGSSSKDRSIEFEFANHYSDIYSPEDQFKQRFFSDWDQTAWQQFDNFMMYCICVYLGNGIIEPQNVNLEQRKLLDQTHQYFLDFMYEKINSGEIVAGKELWKQELHTQFLEENPDLKEDKYRRKLETFTKWLKIFAKYAGHFDYEVQERKSGANRFITFSHKKRGV